MTQEISIVKELARQTLKEKWLNPESYIIEEDDCAFCRDVSEKLKDECGTPLDMSIDESCDKCHVPYLLCCGCRRPTATKAPECLFELITLQRDFPETTTFMEYQQGKLNAVDSQHIGLMIKALRELAQRGKLKRGTQRRITRLVQDARDSIPRSVL
jgi:hypothetical protein